MPFNHISYENAKFDTQNEKLEMGEYSKGNVGI